MGNWEQTELVGNGLGFRFKVNCSLVGSGPMRGVSPVLGGNREQRALRGNGPKNIPFKSVSFGIVENCMH